MRLIIILTPVIKQSQRLEEDYKRKSSLGYVNLTKYDQSSVIKS